MPARDGLLKHHKTHKMQVFSKEADTDYPIHDLLRRRWSPRAFSSEAVEDEKLRRLFEAARWAPSASNQQPWRFIIGRKGDDTYDRIIQTLVDFNQKWAVTAPVLLISVGRKVLNDKEDINESYRYDVGLAVAQIAIQATEEGLYIHQMGGFDPAMAVRLFNIPAMYKPLTVIAIGYIGNPEVLPEKLEALEYKKRERFPASSFVFSGHFGEADKLF